MGCCLSDSSYFNRFTSLDAFEWRILMYLVESQSNYGDKLWKILKYDTIDCLLQSPVSRADRLDLIYVNNGDATPKRAFMTPYVDDAWVEQSSHLHIFIDSIVPRTNLSAVVNIGVETIIHNKIANIYGDADADALGQLTEEYQKYRESLLLDCDTSLGYANPAEFDSEGNPTVLYKSRATVLLKSVLAELNGASVGGVGQLQFNQQLSTSSLARQQLWNSRNFFGHYSVFSVIVSESSDNPDCGY